MVRYTILRKTSPKERLLIQLLENKRPLSIRELAHSASVDYKNTYILIKELQKNLVSNQKIGNTNLIRINLVPNQDIISAEQRRTQNFLVKNPKISLIKKTAEELNYPFLIVLVFGSYAKKEDHPNSDIDLCIICDNKEVSSEMIKRVSLFSLKLEIQEFTTKEFTSMIEKKQENLGNEIIRSNIILYGVENYYNLISKWTKKE